MNEKLGPKIVNQIITLFFGVMLGAVGYSFTFGQTLTAKLASMNDCQIRQQGQIEQLQTADVRQSADLNAIKPMIAESIKQCTAIMMWLEAHGGDGLQRKSQ